ncbi:MAG: dimethyl sulfoxide reductase anchor subunit [Rubrivivax sp.]|nr:dimethyl sulfoxide reductase anchor subunit [Rubrivivax sp.]
MSYGPNPWLQRHWDARAAANFMAGGAGSGLVVAAALAGSGAGPLVLGALLVGLGLLAVWFEIGRPLRALNVFRRPQSSWMTREGGVALVLFAAVAVAVAAALAGSPARWPAVVAALAALAFAWCQGRILHAAKGIPAWREPLIVPLVLSTAVAEGIGLWWLLRFGGAAALPASFTAALMTALLAAALAVRLGVWLAWRRRLQAARAAPRALAAIDRAGRIFKGSTLAALALAVVALLAPQAPGLALIGPAAGALALAGGLWFKFTLIVRAAFNQGFALPHLPVRGVAHVRPDLRRGERPAGPR